MTARRSSRRAAGAGGGANAKAADDSVGATGTAVLNENAGDDSGGRLGRSGSLRTTVGTDGCGETRATSSSISRFDLPAASANTLLWLSVVRCGASKRNPV